MTTRRMNIWGTKPPYPKSPETKKPSTPRMVIPQFKTTEEVEAERKKALHEDQDNVRPERDPSYRSTTVTEEPRSNKPTTRSKRRGYSISICVSEEEEAILRKAASDEGMTFSGWARHNLFKAANTKIPKRHR